jgi:predicted glycosyltransferase
MRLLMYSQDGMGLGHLRRTHNIASEILASQPDARILVVADSPVAPFFTPIPGMTFLKLQTIVKVGKNDWRSGSQTMSIGEAVDKRGQQIVDAYREFQPDVISVDHMPLGALGELKPLLDTASEEKKRPNIVLGLRDVLDDPETIHDVWDDLGAYDYLERYNSVLIYGCKDVYDAEAAYNLAPRARAVTYCNYVAHRTSEQPAPPVEDQPFVLVMGGGGADAFPLAKTFLDAMPAILRTRPLRALIITGPNMPDADRQTLIAQAAGQPVEIETSVEDPTSLLRRATAVVTMGGYNSLVEVLQWRKKALVVPRRAPSAEQQLRTRLFADLGLVRMLDPEDLAPSQLGDALLALLEDDSVPVASNVPPLDGAQRAAVLLLNGHGAASEGMLQDRLAVSN